MLGRGPLAAAVLLPQYGSISRMVTAAVHRGFLLIKYSTSIHSKLAAREAGTRGWYMWHAHVAGARGRCSTHVGNRTGRDIAP